MSLRGSGAGGSRKFFRPEARNLLCAAIVFWLLIFLVSALCSEVVARVAMQKESRTVECVFDCLVPTFVLRGRDASQAVTRGARQVVDVELACSVAETPHS